MRWFQSNLRMVESSTELPVAVYTGLPFGLKTLDGRLFYWTTGQDPAVDEETRAPRYHLWAEVFRPEVRRELRSEWDYYTTWRSAIMGRSLDEFNALYYGEWPGDYSPYRSRLPGAERSAADDL